MTVSCSTNVLAANGWMVRRVWRLVCGEFYVVNVEASRIDRNGWIEIGFSREGIEGDKNFKRKLNFGFTTEVL